jgi:hypothetical protein
MRALTLTQPWAGLVASGVKLVENRPRSMIKAEDFGKPFAIHASREIDESVYTRVAEIASDVCPAAFTAFDPDAMVPPSMAWYRLSRITSAVIAVATIDKVFDGSWDAGTIRDNADVLSFSNGDKLGPAQVRWFFGPVGYVLRDVIALPTPVPCKGALGFWTLPADVDAKVRAQSEVP